MIGTLLDKIREKHFEKWIGGYARWRLTKPASSPIRPRHLLFAVCDHWEPAWSNATRAAGDARVRAWAEGYPRLAADFRDADGRPPRHSFFFPGEQYQPEWLDALAELGRGGFGEVELHLHHDGDTAERLRADLDRYLEIFVRHGHLTRVGGRPRYAFIHGNWCLANARADGRYCGVDDELPLLFDSGCYADFTFPACPDESQPNIVNQIYWPVGDLARRRAYEQGVRARVGTVMHDRILLITGPLAVGPRTGHIVGLEYGALQAANPPTPDRVASWVEQEIHVEGRPEWIFVKVYTHGAPEAQAAAYLGDGGRALHRELTTRYNDREQWKLHYVTAREMYNVVRAALDGKSGDPGEFRDYVLPPPPLR